MGTTNASSNQFLNNAWMLIVSLLFPTCMWETKAFLAASGKADSTEENFFRSTTY